MTRKFFVCSKPIVLSGTKNVLSIYKSYIPLTSFEEDLAKIFSVMIRRKNTEKAKTCILVCLKINDYQEKDNFMHYLVPVFYVVPILKISDNYVPFVNN